MVLMLLLLSHNTYHGTDVTVSAMHYTYHGTDVTVPVTQYTPWY